MSSPAEALDLALLTARPHRAAPEGAVATLYLPSLDEQGAARLLGSKRLAARVDALIGEQFEPAFVLAEADRAIVAAGPQAWRAIGLAAGAIIHGGRIRRLVAGAEIARFTERCGAEARQAALSNAPPASACPSQNSGDLAADVTAAGDAAFAAWRASLPHCWRQRLALFVSEPAFCPDDGLAALYREAARVRA